MTFVDFVTPVPADWLNNVNFVVNQYPFSSTITYTAPYTGAVTRTISNKFATEAVSVLDFGAKGDGVTDDTVAIQAAINTGKPVHIPATTAGYFITNALFVNTQGQVIYGDGNINTTIFVDTSFNASAQGIFVLQAPTGTGSTPGYGPGTIPGIELHSFKITCIQPDTAIRANLNTYPVQVYMQNQPRTRFVDMAMTLGTNGVDMRGNSGGVYFVNCHMSQFNIGVIIDGALDSVRFLGCHFWPFDMTNNQTTAYSSVGSIGLQIARMDDLHIADCLFFPYSAITATTGSTGSCFGQITNTDFDTNCNVDLSGLNGDLRFSSCYFSTSSNSQWLQVTNGQKASFDNCSFVVGNVSTSVLIQVTGSPGGYAKFSNCLLTAGASDQTFCNVSGSGTGVNTPTVMFTGCQFTRNPGENFATPIILQGTNGRVSMVGCRVDDQVSGSSVALAIGADDEHVIVGNCFGGMSVILPSARSSTLFNDNTLVGSGTLQSGQVNTTTSGAGQVTVTHNFGVAPAKVWINVVNSTTPIFAQATGFSANTFLVNFWSAGGASLNSTAIIFDWKMEF